MPIQEEFEDTKGVIRIRISKKNGQHNGQKKKDKQRSTKHTHKTKVRVTRTPQTIVVELRCSGGRGSSCSTSGNRRVNLVTNSAILLDSSSAPRNHFQIINVHLFHQRLKQGFRVTVTLAN